MNYYILLILLVTFPSYALEQKEQKPNARAVELLDKNLEEKRDELRQLEDKDFHTMAMVVTGLGSTILIALNFGIESLVRPPLDPMEGVVATLGLTFFPLIAGFNYRKHINNLQRKKAIEKEINHHQSLLSKYRNQN